MNNKLNFCLIKASLPSYFPDKYDVWGKSLSGLKKICKGLNVNLKIIDEIPRMQTMLKMLLQNVIK